METSEVEYDQVRALVGDRLAQQATHAIKTSIEDSLPRIANQAIFERLTVTERGRDRRQTSSVLRRRALCPRQDSNLRPSD